MNRAEIGISKCNGCSQHLLRDATFSKWLQGRKSDHKKPSARCNACYDKDEKGNKNDMARATTSMVVQSQTNSAVIQTQTQERVSVSPQATQENVACPLCRGKTSIDMAKLWQANGRHRFVNQCCLECTTRSRLGTWFRCKDHNDQTISDWLEAIECSGIV